MVRCMLQTVHAVLVLHQPCIPSRCRLGNFKDDVGLFNVILCLSLSLREMRGLTAYSLPSNSKIDRSRSTSSTERKQSSLSLSRSKPC
jgi:hypothetical protein